MCYSLRRSSSLDSVDGGTHNPTIGGSDLPSEVVPETQAQAGWDRSEMFLEVRDPEVLPVPARHKMGPDGGISGLRDMLMKAIIRRSAITQ